MSRKIPDVEALRAIVARDGKMEYGDRSFWVPAAHDRRTLLALVGALRPIVADFIFSHQRDSGFGNTGCRCTACGKGRELLALCDAAGIEGERRG